MADHWDNAVAESFFKTLKVELIHQVELKKMKDTEFEVFEFLEIWHNRQRIHASLDYPIPDEYRIKLNQHQNAT